MKVMIGTKQLSVSCHTNALLNCEGYSLSTGEQGTKAQNTPIIPSTLMIK